MTAEWKSGCETAIVVPKQGSATIYAHGDKERLLVRLGQNYQEGSVRIAYARRLHPDNT